MDTNRMDNADGTSDLIEAEYTVTISNKRHVVALECNWEIQKLCEVIANLVPVADDQNFFAVRGIAARMYELSEIVLLALSDESETTSGLAERLRFGSGEVKA